MKLETQVKKQLERSNKTILDLRSLKIETIENENDYGGINLLRKVIKTTKPTPGNAILEKVSIEQKCTLTKDVLSNVKCLLLSYNNIERIDFHFLQQLNSLEVLDLSHNNLSEIQNQENTSSTLLELYLNKNNFKQIEAYEGLKHFRKLQVLRIDYEIFKDPNDFDKLDSIIGEEYVVNVKIFIIKKFIQCFFMIWKRDRDRRVH